MKPQDHQFLPLRFDGMQKDSYFTVNPDIRMLLVSREFIAENNLWDYKFEQEILCPKQEVDWWPATSLGSTFSWWRKNLSRCSGRHLRRMRTDRRKIPYGRL